MAVCHHVAFAVLCGEYAPAKCSLPGPRLVARLGRASAALESRALRRSSRAKEAGKGANTFEKIQKSKSTE